MKKFGRVSKEKLKPLMVAKKLIGHFEEKNGSKYLVLGDVDKNK